MTEILTESFCERCGTRYTFESAAPRQKRIGGLKVLGRGLKNFVLSDDSSLDEAFAAARSDAEHALTAHQLDAFHATFNFCMSCRQYTCANCWNEAEARCLSCAPLAGLETLPLVDTEIDPDRLLRFLGSASNGAPAASEALVAADHVHGSELIGDEIREAEVIAEAQATAVAQAAAAQQAELDEAAETAAALAADAAQAAAHAATVGAGPVEDPLGPEAADEPTVEGFEPGQSIDEAIAAYEASQATDAFAAAGEPAAVAEALAESEAEQTALASSAAAEAPVEPQMESVAAEISASAAQPLAAPEPAAQPEPVAAEVAEPEPAAAEAPQPEATPSPPSPGVDVINQPVWPVAATPSPVPDADPQAPAPSGPPAWPTGPRWPTAMPARQAAPPLAPASDPLAALMARTSTEAMWAASSRDVLQPIPAAAAVAAVQPCTNCGISLSATARFCRRCGTPQG